MWFIESLLLAAIVITLCFHVSDTVLYIVYYYELCKFKLMSMLLIIVGVRVRGGRGRCFGDGFGCIYGGGRDFSFLGFVGR